MCFSCKMCRLEKESAVLEGTIFKNSLLNSLLAGNLVRERLAPDCLLRHTVWSAEKFDGHFLTIMRKARQFSIFLRLTALETMDCATRHPQESFIFSGRRIGSPVSGPPRSLHCREICLHYS